MRDHNHGQIMFAVQFLQQMINIFGGAPVEIAGRFIGQQQARPHDSRPGRWPPAAARRRRVPPACGCRRWPKTDFSEQSLQPQRPSFAGWRAISSRHHDIFQGSEFGQELVKLKDKTDGAIAKGVEEPARAGRRYPSPAKQHRPPLRTIESAEDMHEGTLAGAGSPDHRNPFATGNGRSIPRSTSTRRSPEIKLFVRPLISIIKASFRLRVSGKRMQVKGIETIFLLRIPEA